MRPPARRTPRWLRWGLFALALFSYLFLTGAVRDGGPAGPDAVVLGALADLRAPWLDRSVLFVTHIGDAWAMTLLSLVAIALLARVSGRSAIFFAASMAGAAGIHLALKALTARPRPSLAPVYEPGGWSFPSGHAMGTFCFFIALALVVRQLRHEWQWRAAVVAVAAVGLVGATRVYLGVHYPTDILAGWAIGAVWVALLYSWYRHGFVAEPAAAVERDEGLTSPIRGSRG